MSVHRSVGWLVCPSHKRLNRAKLPILASFFMPVTSHTFPHSFSFSRSFFQSLICSFIKNVHSHILNQRGAHIGHNLALFYEIRQTRVFTHFFRSGKALGCTGNIHSNIWLKLTLILKTSQGRTFETK